KLKLWFNIVLQKVNGLRCNALHVSFLFIWVAVAFFSPANATVHAQQITLHVKNTPLEDVFKSIMKQSDYVYIYNSSKINKTRVSVDIEHSMITQVLAE